MKRIRIKYTCDVCGEPIEAAETRDDWTGRNWGLCSGCREAGYELQIRPLAESDGCLVRILNNGQVSSIHNC